MNLFQNYTLICQNFQDLDRRLSQWIECTSNKSSDTLKKCDEIHPDISEFKLFLKTLILSNIQMKNTLNSLKDSSDYNEKLQLRSNLCVIKDQINAFHQVLGNRAYMKAVKKKLLKIKKKRSYIAKRKGSSSSSDVISKEFDIQENCYDSLLIQDNFNKDVECKKRLETNSFQIELNGLIKHQKVLEDKVELIQSLLKLRHIRSEKRTEVSIFDEEDTFGERMNKLLNELQEKITEVNLEKESVNKRIKQMNKTSSITDNEINIHIRDEIKTALFGNLNEECDWFYNESYKDLNKFVSIRSQWDSFIVDHNDISCSYLPIGWVLPQEPSSESWKKYLS